MIEVLLTIFCLKLVRMIVRIRGFDIMRVWLKCYVFVFIIFFGVRICYLILCLKVFAITHLFTSLSLTFLSNILFIVFVILSLFHFAYFCPSIDPFIFLFLSISLLLFPFVFPFLSIFIFPFTFTWFPLCISTFH